MEWDPQLFMVVIGGLISLGLCFSMGANDESMASAYGAKSLSMAKALAIGSAMQVIGSVILGSEVTVTIQGKLFDTSVFEEDIDLLLLVFLTSVIGATVFLMCTSRFGLPVSTTHAVVGALACAAVAAKGWSILNVDEVIKIALSWLASPVAGGVVTVLVYNTFYFSINGRKDPFETAMMLAPVFYGLCICAVMGFVLFNGIPIPDDFPEWILALIMIACGLFTFVFMKVLFSRVIRGRILQYFGENYVFYEEKPSLQELEMKENEKSSSKSNYETTSDSSVQGMNEEEGSMPVYIFYEEEPTNNTTNHPEDAAASTRDYGQQKSVEITSTSESTVSASESAVSESESERTTSPSENENENKDTDEDLEANNNNKKDKKKKQKKNKREEIDGEATIPLGNEKVERVFFYLQPLTATLVTFARAVADVSHGIGCWTAMYALYDKGREAFPLSAQPVPYWALAVGGLAIGLGLIALGRLVIKSVGTTITALSPSRGVAIEVGTAITVLVFSKLGIPVSSTHTLVGCIFAIGVSTDVRNSITRWWAIRRAKKAGVSIPEEHVEKKKSALNIKRVIIIAVTWIGTLPLSGCLSAALVAIFRNTL